MDYFNFIKWFNSLKTSYEIYDKSEFALLDIIANGLDISKYKKSYTLIPNNYGFIEKDENGKYFVEVQLQRNDCDISTGFILYPFYESNNSSSEVKIILKIDDKILPINTGTLIVNSCAIYTELKVRLIFDKDAFAVKFIYLSHMLDTKLRADLHP
jgi:hypothetical protein